MLSQPSNNQSELIASSWCFRRLRSLTFIEGVIISLSTDHSTGSRMILRATSYPFHFGSSMLFSCKLDSSQVLTPSSAHIAALSAGTETREYYGGGQRWRFLQVTIRGYVNQEDPTEALCLLLEDIEYVLDNNNQLTYSDSYGSAGVAQISVISIDTDEGVLAPLGIGEMIIEVRY